MHDTNLNQSQKFILAEIEQLCSLDSGCFASNNHFAELIGITKENVSRNINDLKDMGYIDIKIENGSRNHVRMITLTNLVRPPYQNSKTPLSKRQETKDNIQSNKTNNTDASLLSKFREDTNAGDIAMELATWFIQYRKEIKKPIKTISPLVNLIMVMRQCVNAGYKIEEVKELIKVKEWQSVKLEWVQKEIVREKEWGNP